ncbi:MAG: hypothetical protein IID41_06340, partial [Planctomycetes bacterium]|nr:hypothetical protein [Planctomycetota bacterium]
FWPRPYALPAGDGLAYYSGARHIAAEGRYDDDYSQRPAIPLIRHPPLFSMLWGGLLYFGIAPATALWLLQAAFLCALGAAGGVLAYRITQSWVGPLLWTVFSCFWPGGDNWIFWIQPLTETGTAAFFVIVCWMLSNALRSTGRGEAAWLLLAAIAAGLSMILKVTGVFCLPVVVVMSLVIFRRGAGGSRWWVVALSTLLIVLPFSLWALRNILLAGTIEAGKISHEPEMLWGLMANLAANTAGWFLPRQLAQIASANLHPLAIMLPVVLLPVLLTAHAAYRRCPEALLAGACASLAFVGLAVMMVTKFTEETRYWSVMLPCVVLAALAMKPPTSKTAGLVFRVTVTLFVLFCCARFSIARQYLWYGTSLGFFVQQAFLACSLIGGLLYLHRLIREFWAVSNRVLPHVVAIVACGIVATGLWRFGHTPKPAYVFATLCLTGVLISLPLGTGRRGALWRGLLCFLPLVVSWWLGGWMRTVPPKSLTIALDGVEVQIRADVYSARQLLAEGHWPTTFVSNAEEYLIDLFGDHSVLPLPWYRSIARFRSHLPQLPEDEERSKREWLAGLRRDNVTEPFVMVMFPQYAARAYYYGPQDFESMPELDVEWIVHDADMHIAICQLSSE